MDAARDFANKQYDDRHGVNGSDVNHPLTEIRNTPWRSWRPWRR
jgi:hypothetical protein